MLLASDLLLAAAAPEAPGPMFDAFKAACARTGDLEAMKADAAAAGWEAMAEEADPRVAKLNRLGREAVGAQAELSGATYRRRLSGRSHRRRERPGAGISTPLGPVPGWRDGVTVEASHVPPGHPLGEAFGVEGNVLIAQAIGGF